MQGDQLEIVLSVYDVGIYKNMMWIFKYTLSVITKTYVYSKVIYFFRYTCIHRSILRVKLGEIGHKVNSDTHLQKV